MKINILIFCSVFITTLVTSNNICLAIEQTNTANDFATISPPSKINDTAFGASRRLSLSACFHTADQENKEIAIATSNMTSAQAAIVIAKAIPNPTYTMTYGWGPAWKYVIAGNNQQFGWNEEIQIAGKRTKKVAVARANLFQTAFQIQAVRFDVHNRVRRAYSELAVARAYANLLINQEKVSQELFQIAKNRFIAGKAPGSEVLQAKLTIMQLNVQANQARSRLIQDSARLAFLLGETPHNQNIIEVENSGLIQLLSGTGDTTPTPELGVPSLEQLLPTAWKERNDLKAAIQQAYADRKALTLAKSQRIADPFVGFDYLFSTYTPFQQQYYTPQPNARAVPYQPGYLLTAATEAPICYQHQGEVNLAKATWTQQLKQNDQLLSQIATDVITAYEAVLLNIENMHKFQKALVPDALKAARLSRRGYELGKTDLATAILAQQQYGQLVSSYFDSAIAYQSAWVDLEKAIGVPLKL